MAGNKKKIPRITSAMVNRFNKEGSIILIPAPGKGKAIRICSDGLHYEIITTKKTNKMADYLVKIQQDKIDLGNRLRAIRHQNKVTLETVEEVFGLAIVESIEGGHSITDHGEMITIDTLLKYCELIGAGIGPYNKTPEEEEKWRCSKYVSRLGVGACKYCGKTLAEH